MPSAPHVAVWHSLGAVQATHATPPVPHALGALPIAQVLPLLQPVQHAPPRHCPPLHPVVSMTFDVVHCPVELQAAV